MVFKPGFIDLSFKVETVIDDLGSSREGSRTDSEVRSSFKVKGVFTFPAPRPSELAS